MTKCQPRIAKVALLSAEVWRLGLSPSSNGWETATCIFRQKSSGRKGNVGKVGKLETQRRDRLGQICLSIVSTRKRRKRVENFSMFFPAITASRATLPSPTRLDTALDSEPSGPLHEAARDQATAEQAKDEATTGR